MTNKIPRNFKVITGEMLINTTANVVGDTVQITKEYNRYTLTNTRTNEKFQCLVSMLRNKNIIKFLNVE